MQACQKAWDLFRYGEQECPVSWSYNTLRLNLDWSALMAFTAPHLSLVG